MDDSKRSHKMLGVIYLLWNLAFVGAAVVITGRTSLRVYNGGIPVKQLSFQNYAVLTDPLFKSALISTVQLALVVALLVTVLALLLVLSVWQLEKVGARRAVLFGLASVYFAGVVPRTQAMVFLLSPTGPLHFTGIVQSSGGAGILYTIQGVVLGFLPILLPLATAVVAVFRYSIPEAYIDAARDIGASGLQTTLHIVVPLLLPGLVICGILCFVLVLGDVIVVDLLGGSQVYTLATQVVDEFKINDWGRASAVAVFILAIIGTLLGVVTASISRITGNL